MKYNDERGTMNDELALFILHPSAFILVFLILPPCRKPRSSPFAFTTASAPTPFSFINACAELSVVAGSTNRPLATGRITDCTRVVVQRSRGRVFKSASAR